ncbi:MAG: amylo-alpha-1,6-glucosidase [Candidatus Dormibacteraeota bacterium]|nr:amylo-alpha-1,6-glucosidase [Candidatus Dormibacteraeota bacterium]
MSSSTKPVPLRRRTGYLTASDLLTTKLGDLFLLCRLDGDMDPMGGGGQGIYFLDTRFVDELRLRLGARQLKVVSASTPSLERSVSQLRAGPFDIDRERSLGGVISETITVHNRSRIPVETPVELELTSNFASIFQVRGLPRGRRGRLAEPRWEGDELVLRYDGADGHARTVRARFIPGPEYREPVMAGWRLRLLPRQQAVLRVELRIEETAKGKTFSPSARHPSGSRGPRPVETDNPAFNDVLDRALDDLRLLTNGPPMPYICAGLPWYGALFGRDSLITALQTLAFRPELAAGTIRRLAALQGRRVDAGREEEPGKILHELRYDEMTNLGELPYAPSYGTVDATPLFVILVAEHIRWTGDLAFWRRLRPKVERALAWCEKFGDGDGDGFLDYNVRTADGRIRNEAWKDAGNGITERDGRLVEPPIAIVEVQGYLYRAWLQAATLFRLDGEEERAAGFEAKAAALRRHFRAAYWIPGRRYLAVAIGSEGRADSITSNPGQALWGGIVDRDHARSVARRLLGSELFNGWGIRTMGAAEAAYDPDEYQSGSVWPHDNALIMDGLRRYGFAAEAEKVFTAIFEVAQQFPDGRLPELFAGYQRTPGSRPIPYPETCSPQAWAAGAIPYMLTSSLGLEPDALNGRLQIVRPALPAFLQEVRLRDITVGIGSADLRWRRKGKSTTVEVMGTQGKLQVDIESGAARRK